MLLFARLESGIGSLIHSVVIANPDFFTLFSQHWVVFWDYFFNSKGHHVSPVMSRLAKVSSNWLCLVFFVDVLSVVLNPVAKSPSSFTDVKEIRTQPTLNLVNHILGQACHVAVDLPCFSSDPVCMGGMAS